MIAPPRKYVTTSQGRIAYQRAGAGPSVILIHGSLVTADDMVLALMSALVDRYDVVAFDRPGHGDSDQTRVDEGSPWFQAMAIAEAWKAMGIIRPVVLGHSFGGAVALSIGMTEAAEISGVVALAPICFPEMRLEHIMLAPRAVPNVGELYAQTIGLRSDVVTLPLLRNAMFLPQTMPKEYAKAYPFAWASRPSCMIADAKDAYALFRALTLSTMRYSSCKAPVIIFGGTNDLVVINERHGLIAANLLPSASFKWIAGMGHMAHHFCQAMIREAITSVGN